MGLRGAENYNIGLDIGTGSVGWAVTDENGELYHFKGKPTWGSRLFSSAEPASKARIPRGQRRRYDRRRQRLDLLQGIFMDEMEAVDPEFFIRLRQSRLLKEDRAADHADYRWPLFNASDFTEADYYKKFPTIYHLRAHLMETEEPADIRLIYLAFHNIVKTRGNFLHQDNPSLSAKSASMKDSVSRLVYAIEQWCGERDLECNCDLEAMCTVLEDAGERRASKRDQLMSLFGFDSEGRSRAKEIAGAVLGYIADFGKIFAIEGEGLKFALGNDEATEGFYSSCPDDGIELYEALRAVYSANILLGILKGANGQTISYCKIGEYERYKNDLLLLKSLVREYRPSEYDDFFRGPHYADARWKKDYDPAKAKGYTLYNLGTSRCSYEDFHKTVRKLFKGTAAEADERYVRMDQSFTEGTFLRRLKTSDNGSIPYQLHLEEMRAIIESQGKHHPFLLTERKKLESLVSFRIPYYVGPLTTKNARHAGDSPEGELRFAWSERIPGKENARVLPWNWEEVIDKQKSAEHFIRRMTGTCTYLQGEPVLPRCSLLYEKYCVLNELNGSHWTQDGDKDFRFSADDRLGIYEDLFKNAARSASVSYKNVEDWLVRHNRTRPHVRGGQGETKYESKLASHHFFCQVLNVEDIDASLEPMVEELILWNTLFEDRAILREKIQKTYGDKLTDDQIKKICKKRFTGWGKLSKKFLCGVKANTANGSMSIMDILEEGNPEGQHVGSAMILMEILHDDHFGFGELIDKANAERASASGGMAIEELPGSPALRRSVNQALRIVEEIAGIAGHQPANIFIEVTRDDDEKKKGRRTTRRYDGLKEALAALKDDGAESLRQLRGLSAAELDDALSLYFMQNAKCMYCGKPLVIEHVISGDHAYQIDHIIPQSYVKDDSFENRVLVCSSCNQKKTDALLIDPSIRRSMSGYWRALHNAKLIGDKKFNNLMRDHITETQARNFINRQLVETSQVVKLTRLMLAERYPEANVVSIKASLSHQLREERGFIKCREANDFHHAHDALLAAEIGRFIQFRHGKLIDNPIAATHAMRAYVRSQSEFFKKHHRMPGSASFIIGSFLTSGFDKDTGEVFKDTWDAEAECSKIRRYLDYKQCFISRMPEITSGAFWDATIYSPKQSIKKLELPLKKGLDPKKYGSYSREQFAYFFVYKALKRGRPVFEFASVPVSVATRVEKDPSALEAYARSLAIDNGLEFVEVSRRRVFKYQMIAVSGERLYITGLKEARNATQMAFSQAEMSLIKQIVSGERIAVSELDSILERVVKGLGAVSVKLSNQMKVQELLKRAGNVDQDKKERGVLALISIANASTNMIDLSAFGGSKCAGCMRFTYAKLISSGNLEFIDQSVTGMFERRQRLEL